MCKGIWRVCSRPFATRVLGCGDVVQVLAVRRLSIESALQRCTCCVICWLVITTMSVGLLHVGQVLAVHAVYGKCHTRHVSTALGLLL
jgi:hypothetical protein